jgi:pimeloyl-ACP methyl ester carboxylesterase
MCIDYFTEYFEKWRIKMGIHEKFHLAGHSLGGYLVGNYVCKYPYNIKKLLLISPCGIYDKRLKSKNRDSQLKYQMP